MANLEPVGHRIEKIKEGDVIFYYKENESFGSPVPVHVTECNNDGSFQVRGNDGGGGMLRHDHAYRRALNDDKQTM